MSTNTHTYDGQLNPTNLPGLILISGFTIEEKRIRGKELLYSVKSIINSEAYEFLQRIVASIGTSENIDTTNNLVADNLLCLCWIYREDITFVKELEIQLLDMKTGFCPQGRTHRLFQLLLAFLL